MFNSKSDQSDSAPKSSTKKVAPDHAPIDTIRLYQAVTFRGSAETFFATRKINTRPECTITINPLYAAVEIKDDKDHIMVPLTNVSCIYFLSAIKQAQIDKTKTEAERRAEAKGIKSHEIPRPK